MDPEMFPTNSWILCYLYCRRDFKVLRWVGTVIYVCDYGHLHYRQTNKGLTTEGKVDDHGNRH